MRGKMSEKYLIPEKYSIKGKEEQKICSSTRRKHGSDDGTRGRNNTKKLGANKRKENTAVYEKNKIKILTVYVVQQNSHSIRY